MSAGLGSTVTTVAGWEPPLPRARGPLTGRLLAALAGSPGDVDVDVDSDPAPDVDPLADDDLHLALYVCYELHYRGFAGVDEHWEWNPSLLAFRSRLERLFEAGLRRRFGAGAGAAPVTGRADTVAALIGVANQPGPSLSRYVRDRATAAELEEFLVHKSPYQLKEFDPQSWVIPRLEGSAKAAMVEVAFDEYGCGRTDLIHATLFRNTMEALGLDGRYGAYLDRIPASTLAPVNLMSMFGLHRRLRGAAVGHLVIGELTSSLSTKRVGDGLRRLGHGPDATHFFDEHVIADSIHDMVTLHDLAGGMAERDPRMAADLVFGASAGAGIDAMFARHLLDSWARQESSLRPGPAPVPPAAAAVAAG